MGKRRRRRSRSGTSNSSSDDDASGLRARRHRRKWHDEFAFRTYGGSTCDSLQLETSALHKDAYTAMCELDDTEITTNKDHRDRLAKIKIAISNHKRDITCLHAEQYKLGEAIRAGASRLNSSAHEWLLDHIILLERAMFNTQKGCVVVHYGTSPLPRMFVGDSQIQDLELMITQLQILMDRRLETLIARPITISIPASARYRGTHTKFRCDRSNLKLATFYDDALRKLKSPISICDDTVVDYNRSDFKDMYDKMDALGRITDNLNQTPRMGFVTGYLQMAATLYSAEPLYRVEPREDSVDLPLR